MKTTNVVLGILMPFIMVYSQEVKFGKVSMEELKETQYINDPEADAAILYKELSTYIVSRNGMNSLITEVHERIKVYTKDGADYATEELFLYKNRSDGERVGKIKAFTYNLVNGKIEKTELDKEQVFETEHSYYYDKVSFTMPNVQEGSVIEFSYKITSPFIWSVDDFVFQYEIPVKKMVARLSTPKGFTYKRIPKGNLMFFPKTTTKMDNRLGMFVEVHTYYINNVPALKEENFVDNIDNYRAGASFELMTISIDGYFKSYSQTWQDVAKHIGSTSDYKNELDKTRAFDDELDALLAKHPTPYDKMAAIFGYVKENMTWNGIDGWYFFNGIKKTLKEKKGNAADINLTLVGMLRYAGINAHPVVISTKDNAIPFFPTIDRLNYVVAYVEIEDKPYFLDATEEYSDINILPIKDYNWQGILINNPDKKWNTVYFTQPKKSNQMYSIQGELAEDGSCTGSVNTRYTDHSALDFRKSFNKMGEEGYVKQMETNYPDVEISNYRAKNASVYSGPVSESYDFYMDFGAEEIEDKLYFNPLSFLKMEENPFKSEKREYPVDFGHPFKNTYMAKYKIPEGYQVASLPQPVKISLPDNKGSFRYTIADQGGMLNLVVSYEIDEAIIPADYYPYLKEYYKQIIAKEEEPVVFSKL